MKSIIALGFFDGVHIGHGALIRRANELAVECGVQTAVMTFDTAPLAQINGIGVQSITSVYDRKRLIYSLYGAENVIVLKFDRALMNTPAQTFIENLCSEYEAAGFVCGYDFRFGKGGAGTSETVRALCEEKGLAFSVVDEVSLHGERISSTLIKSFLHVGDMQSAEDYLGHYHVMTGNANRERSTVFPSIRIVPDTGVMLPMPGLYETKLVAPDNREYGAVTSVGESSTVSRVFGGDIDPVPPRLRIEFIRFIEQ